MSASNIAPFAVTFRRLTGHPLEDNVYFATLLAAQTYANSATALVGQTVIVVSANVNEPIRQYIIDRNRTLKEVFSLPPVPGENEVLLTAVGGVMAWKTIESVIPPIDLSAANALLAHILTAIIGDE